MFDKVDTQKPKHLLAIIGTFFIFAALPLTVYLVLTSQERAREGPQAAVDLKGDLEEATVVGGLSFPSAMEFAPDGRLFVAEQGGSLRVIKNDKLLPTPFLSVSVATGFDRGLIGITFDPDFKNNKFVYIHYTRSSPIEGRVSRFTASATNPDVAVPGSEVVILDNIPSPTDAHQGGAIHFGKDGKLYIGVGDGGLDDKYGKNSQDLSNLKGKILRINKDGSIPADNPFVDQAGKRGEIWAYGLRNPYTFAVDPVDGKIYVNDVGFADWEEVNLLQKGANYGWPTCEGPQSDDAIYVVDYESGTVQKRLITPSAFNGLGYDSGEVFLVDETNLPTTNGPDISNATVHPDGTLVKVEGFITIYYLLEDGNKRFNVLPAILTSNGFDPTKAKEATSADLNLPDGPPLNFREGTLIRGSSTTVYAVDYQGSTIRKRAFTSQPVFEGLGFSFEGDVIRVADSQLPTTNGPNISNANVHPDGTLIRPIGSTTIYLLQDGAKHSFTSRDILMSHNYSVGFKTATAADLALPTGSSLTFREGTLVKTGGLGDCSNTSFTYPIYSYTHSGSGRAITGGVFYRGSQFPSKYVGNYFLSDYLASFIRKLDPSNGNSVADFYTAAKSPVDLKVGPDGSLYYLSVFNGEVHKIQFSRPTAVAFADKTIGEPPFTVSFNGKGSSDPNDLPMTFSWDFGADTSGNGKNVKHTYSFGTFQVKLTVTNSGGASDTADPIIIISTKCADINGDEVVNIIDIGEIVLVFGTTTQSSNWNSDADLNGDGRVNILDIGASVLQFGDPCPFP